MSLIKKICLLFLIVIVLAVGTITLLLSTGFGIRFIVNTAAGWVPGLEISQVEGNLKHLRLSGVAYKTQGIDASAGELSLGIDFSCLTNSRICISELTTKGVNVAIDTALMPPAPSEPEAKPLDELSTPFPIELRLLALDDTKLNVDGTLIALNTFSTGALWQQREIALTPTVIEGLTVSIPKTARPEVDQRPTQSSPVQAPLGETLQNLFSQPLVADLPQISLPVDIVIEKIEGRNLRFVNGEETQLIDQILLKASAKLSDITIETLKVSAPQGTVALTGQASFSKNWPLSLTLNSALNVPELRGEKVRIVLNGEMLGDLKLAVNVSGPVSAQLDADVGLAKPELPLSLTLESKHIQWPVSGKADYNANNFRLRLTGKATDYVLSLRTEISGRDIPPSNITLDGKGNTQRFKLSRLRLNALEGKTELSGVADWSKAISWNLLLTLDGINTLKQWPEWPATIQGKVTNKGSIYGGSWQLEFPEINLNGQVKKQRLSVMGSARGNAAGQWRIPELLIALGKNKIEAKGELAKSWALDASISAPNLNESVPGLRGNVKGLLKLRGTEKAPQLLANLTANGIRWQDFSVAKVSLNGDITSSTQISGDMNLLMERLIVGDNRIRQLTLSANGNEKSHRLLFNADGKQIGGNLTLTGHVNRAKQYWEGSLSNTAFTTPLGNWRLSKDVTLNYSNVNQEATIGAHCWLNPDAEVCLPKAAKVGKTGQVVVDLNRFDLTILKHILQDTGLKGGFSGKADFKWADNGQLPQGSVHLQGKGVEITERLNGNSLPIAFEDIKLNATIRRQNVNLDWIVKLVSNGQFNGNVQVTDPQNARRLSGNITVDRLSLALLKPALADNEKATGILNGSLRLAGSSKAPQILGNLNLQQLALDTQWSPVTVTEGDIKLTFKGFSSALEGVIKTRRGNLTLNGNADWRKVDAWRAKITAKGEKVRIEMPPIVQLDVSPDVTVEASPELVKLDGSVSIPWAKISVKEIPESAVGVSSDEVILNTNLQPVTAQTNSVKIVSNLAINIGPNVAIDAFGLKSMLSGKLKMAQDNKGLGLHGEITLKNGNFRAYGQDLLIKKGLIIFSGPPDRPQLNISAVRNPDATEDGVTAGINVTGFADSPKLEIFSDPAMSQEAALSYLLRGQGLDKSSDDNAMMTSLLIGMGVARSGKLVGKIGETFGVKDLSLDTQGVGDSSQVVVSGYVLPGLQVKYGVGIFDSLATLTLRYRLMPRLYLEGVSGLDQALDILYQFEF